MRVTSFHQLKAGPSICYQVSVDGHDPLAHDHLLLILHLILSFPVADAEKFATIEVIAIEPHTLMNQVHSHRCLDDSEHPVMACAFV